LDNGSENDKKVVDPTLPATLANAKSLPNAHPRFHTQSQPYADLAHAFLALRYILMIDYKMIPD